MQAWQGTTLDVVPVIFSLEEQPSPSRISRNRLPLQLLVGNFVINAVQALEKADVTSRKTAIRTSMLAMIWSAASLKIVARELILIFPIFLKMHLQPKSRGWGSA
jgi:hypothetical protein